MVELVFFRGRRDYWVSYLGGLLFVRVKKVNIYVDYLDFKVLGFGNKINNFLKFSFDFYLSKNLI